MQGRRRTVVFNGGIPNLTVEEPEEKSEHTA
jgi:hypothetical protein